MATTTLPSFLRDRRERLAPETSERRRTPGLRREEVAARAGVSVTWYTWLEQGRGGIPSNDVLERIARALELDDANREVLFLLAHDRPPPRRLAPPAAVTPSLQRVLDNVSVPAFVKTPTYQVVAWNRAAVAVFSDYAAAPERDRNLLRRVFQPGAATKVGNVENVRRTCLASFRVDIARAGPSDEATALIEELMQTSRDFRRLWDEGRFGCTATCRSRSRVAESARSCSSRRCSRSTAATASRCSSGRRRTSRARAPSHAWFNGPAPDPSPRSWLRAAHLLGQ
jgi:transcriptional regulator with XRE-family HTH domain